MKLVLLSLVALVMTVPMMAKGRSSSAKGGTVHVKGRSAKDGTYVAPHNRNAPNRTETDNRSTKGNYNPDTGKRGTKTPKK